MVNNVSDVSMDVFFNWLGNISRKWLVIKSTIPDKDKKIVRQLMNRSKKNLIEISKKLNDLKLTKQQKKLLYGLNSRDTLSKIELIVEETKYAHDNYRNNKNSTKPREKNTK
jgi:hypothetical protein